jgi:hypothetical protein
MSAKAGNQQAAAMAAFLLGCRFGWAGWDRCSVKEWQPSFASTNRNFANAPV